MIGEALPGSHSLAASHDTCRASSTHPASVPVRQLDDTWASHQDQPSSPHPGGPVEMATPHPSAGERVVVVFTMDSQFQRLRDGDARRRNSFCCRIFSGRVDVAVRNEASQS